MELNSKISSADISEINRIDENMIKMALGRMKGTDCLINGPPELLQHLVHMVKTFIMHGEVPYFILVCTLLPLVKDNLGEITQSDNYRAIAASS